MTKIIEYFCYLLQNINYDENIEDGTLQIINIRPHYESVISREIRALSNINPDYKRHQQVVIVDLMEKKEILIIREY